MPEYTFFVIFAVLTSLVLDLFILKTKLLKNPKLYYFFAITTILHTIVDNWLNGRWWFDGYIVGPYPSNFFSGIYVWQTPLENYFYGYSLLLMNLCLLEFLLKKNKGNWREEQIQKEL